MEETSPSDIHSEAAAAAAAPSRPPVATASGSVSTGDVGGTSSASSDMTSNEMMAAKEKFYELHSAAEENEEVPMDTEEITRQRRSRKLEALLKQRKLDLEQQRIVNGALYGAGPWHEVLASDSGDDVTRESMEIL